MKQGLSEGSVQFRHPVGGRQGSLEGSAQCRDPVGGRQGSLEGSAQFRNPSPQRGFYPNYSSIRSKSRRFRIFHRLIDQLVFTYRALACLLEYSCCLPEERRSYLQKCANNSSWSATHRIRCYFPSSNLGSLNSHRSDRFRERKRASQSLPNLIQLGLHLG